MTPQIAPGERFTSIGPLACAFFADMGWPLGPECASLVDTEVAPAATRTGALRVIGANPFATTTRLRLTLDAHGPAEVALYDALGRRVRMLYTGAAAAGTLDVDVRAAGLPAGVYAARATAGGQTHEARLVVTR